MGLPLASTTVKVPVFGSDGADEDGDRGDADRGVGGVADLQVEADAPLQVPLLDVVEQEAPQPQPGPRSELSEATWSR